MNRNEALQRLATNMTVEEAEQLLHVLRWREDQQIINCFGDRVYLKALWVDGKRIGLTDCCFVVEACEHHAALVTVVMSRCRGRDRE